MRLFYVYLLASRSRVLYIGMTNDLERRVREHQLGELEGFTRNTASTGWYFSRAFMARERRSLARSSLKDGVAKRK